MSELPEGWIETTLGESIDLIGGGTPKTSMPEYWNGKIPWLSVADFNDDNRWVSQTEKTITEKGLNNSSTKRLNKNDLIISARGTVGKLAQLKSKMTFNQSCYGIKEKTSISEINYLYYLIKFSLVKISKSTHGAVFDTITRTTFNHIQINLPPLPEQKAIAGVLSAFDEKIELLREQNETLETIAQTIFKELVIKENQDNWKGVTLDEVSTKITDGSHSSPKTVEHGLPMASVKDMHQWGINNDSCRKISKSDFSELVKADCQPLKNDILIAKDGSYLKHIFLAEKDMDVVILSSIAIIRPNGKYASLLLKIYLSLKSTKRSLENIVSGAVIPRIVLKDFRKFALKLPPKEIQDKVLELIQPIHRKCLLNNSQIQTLSKTRDTLLPKLMSGTLRVTL